MVPRTALVALVLLAGFSPAMAQTNPDEKPASALDLSANLGVVSDYRFRGISLSDKGPALQGGVDLEGRHFYVGTWASTIAQYGGADVEVDVYAGVQGGGDVVTWWAGASAYLYPGGSGVNYVELAASAETYVGPLTLTAEAAYAPEQDNVGIANRSLSVRSAFDAGSGFGLVAGAGYEDGFYDGKWDWEFGVNYTRGPLVAAISYVDTDYAPLGDERRLSSGGIVASLLANF